MRGSRWKAPTVLGIALLIAAAGPPGWATDGWRSSLYPDDWRPGYRDQAGRFLHDFSYAGYHRGERPLPSAEGVAGVLLDATAAPFLADPTGTSDATTAIQDAIDQAGILGGGVVFLPAGTYRVHPMTFADTSALYLNRSGVVLRGAGADRTFLYNDETAMRSKSVVRLAPVEVQQVDFNWRWQVLSPVQYLAEDAASLESSVVLEDTSGLERGDWVVVAADATQEFIADHGMTGVWTPEALEGTVFYRQIIAVEPARGRVHLDIPLRYDLLRRDRARVFRSLPHIEEVGVENLAIGMRELDANELGDEDWDVEGTPAYDIHGACAIMVNHVVNGWVRGVESYRPPDNRRFHLLSNGVCIRYARSITVVDTDVRWSQYHGEGGNGYHFSIQGSDSLVSRCFSSYARHNFTCALMVTTGNALHRCRAEHGRLPVDFHMYLSAANLVDAMVFDDDFVEARRRDAADHGHGTTQSVLWNLRGETQGWEVDAGLKVLVESAQFGWGYVVGTSGPDHRVTLPGDTGTAPADFVEGVGDGGRLEPQSLYESQLERRLGPPPRRPHGRLGR